MNTTEMVQIALDLAQLQELPLDSSVSVPGENITRVLAGIDMGAAELTLARQLGYDCVARHHNMVPRLGKLGELVAQSHYEKLVHYGVPVNVAQKLLEHRKRATEIMFHGSNLDGGPSVARLLGMPYLGLHTPAEFNKRHIPACFGGVAPRDWAMVYPFVRSYDWYLKAPEERARIMAEHGRNGFAQYPDVKGSTLSAFGFSDYEWVLAFEADSLDRLEGVMHAQRYTEARLYVREDTPFFTGPRVSLGEWAERQPRA